MTQGTRTGSAREREGQGDERLSAGGHGDGDERLAAGGHGDGDGGRDEDGRGDGAGRDEADAGEDGEDGPEVVTVPVTDELDLHTFAPREVADLVANYLDECVGLGFQEVRIVHGKGTGTLRRVVHGVLDRHPAVASYRLADATRGGWGATLVSLRPRTR